MQIPATTGYGLASARVGAAVRARLCPYGAACKGPALPACERKCEVSVKHCPCAIPARTRRIESAAAAARVLLSNSFEADAAFAELQGAPTCARGAGVHRSMAR